MRIGLRQPNSQRDRSIKIRGPDVRPDEVMPLPSYKLTIFSLMLICWAGGCAQFNFPRIDPSGNRLFLPGNAAIASPGYANAPPFGQPGFRQGFNPVPAYQAPPNPFPCSPYGSVAATAPPVLPPANVPRGNAIGTGVRMPQIPQPKPRILPPAPEVTIPRKSGRIILTPDEIVAPVDSEVVVMAGLCGNDGHYVIRQPIEWMLSQESVGNFVTVADGPNQLISGVFGGGAKKLSTGFAKGTTSASAQRITKGTPSPGDDVYVGKGQTWVSMTSPSEGTTSLTCIAPNANGWDRRRSTAKIHWIDAQWKLPTDVTLRNGQTHELGVTLNRRNGEPVSNWKVKYEIVSGNNVGFLPSGSQEANMTTNSFGQASVGIRQVANGPALAQVRIQVLRPGDPFGSQRQLTVVDQIVNVRWTAPALSIEVAGPNNAGRDAEFTYRVNITNPGDAIARNAVVKLTSIDPKLEIISTSPQGKVVGNQIEWKVGDIQPGQVPISVDMKLRAFRAGDTKTCFTVESAEDQIAPITACMDTKIAVPCIGLKISGPTEARIGETLVYKLRVENQCEQAISGIRLTANYDDGLNFPGQTSPIEQRLNEAIQYGYYKELEIPFIATKSGRQCFTVDVSSSDGSKARIQQCVQVSEDPKPAASIAINGPEVGIISNDPQNPAVGRYTLDVKNTGNVTLTNVEVAVAFDRAFIPRLATGGYRQRETEDELYWLVESIDPGEVLGFAIDQVFTRESDNALHIAKISTRDGVLAKDQTRTVIRPPARNLNAPAPVNPPVNLTNTLKIDGLALTNPVNPNDNVVISVEVLNDRPQQDFESNVVVSIVAPNELQFVSGPNMKITKEVLGNQSTYYVEPIRSLRGSQRFPMKFEFKPTTPDATYTLVVGGKSDRSKLVEKTIEVTVTK